MAIHPTAIIDRAAQIDPTADVGAYAIVDGPVTVGPRARIYPQAYLTGHTEIGADCQIHPFAVIGHLPQDRGFRGERSYCRIGDRTILREGASVHRATGEGKATFVGEDCYIMSNGHVGHNCQVGNFVTIANGGLLAGHVQVGHRANISGNAAVHQFVRIGELVMTSGCTVLTMDVPPFMMLVGRNEYVGINLVGMRRAENTREEIAEVKAAFRVLYRSGVGFREAVRRLDEQMTTPCGRRLMEFLLSPSKRGISGPESRQQHTDRELDRLSGPAEIEA